MKTVEVLVPRQLRAQKEKPRFRLNCRGVLYAAPLPLAEEYDPLQLRAGRRPRNC